MTPSIKFIGISGITATVIACAVSVAMHRPEGTADQLRARADAIVFGKGEAAEAKAGRNQEAVIGADDERSPDASAEVQSYLLRAYPEAEVPGGATINSVWKFTSVRE